MPDEQRVIVTHSWGGMVTVSVRVDCCGETVAVTGVDEDAVIARVDQLVDRHECDISVR